MAASPQHRNDDDAGRPGLLAVGRQRVHVAWSWAGRLLDRYRHRPLVDLVLRIGERDRAAAGTVVGSAVAFRLFLFFVPMLLFIVGLAGFFSDVVSSRHLDDAGITGNLAEQINTALNQPGSTRWIATLTGLVGMASTGRTLSRVLAQASCLAWRMPPRSTASVRVVGSVVGLMIGIGVVSAVVNWIRLSLGIAVTGLSFVAVAVIYAGGWLVLSALLPRPTSGLRALVPGAVLVGLTLTAMQAASQLFLPGRFDKASELYGAIGVTIVTLGWFFIAGRVIVFSLVFDAAVAERRAGEESDAADGHVR